MTYRILQGDVLELLRDIPDESVHCVVTSPPYWGLRDYGMDGQIGLEKTPAEFVAKMVEVFREVRRVLRSDGTCWVNMGDSYAGSWGAQGGPSNLSVPPAGVYADKSPTRNPKLFGLKPKDLCGIPWRLAFALQDDGWWLRQDIIWSKPNPMPESVLDRCTKAHEYLFLLTKSARYYYDADAIKEASVSEPQTRDRNKEGYNPALGSGKDRFSPGARTYTETRNKRSVWEITPEPYAEAHFATFPTELVKPCILAGSPTDGTVLDPFNGAGTTGVVALRYGRNYIGIELNPEYVVMAENRIQQDNPMFNRAEGGENWAKEI